MEDVDMTDVGQSLDEDEQADRRIDGVESTILDHVLGNLSPFRREGQVDDMPTADQPKETDMSFAEASEPAAEALLALTEVAVKESNLESGIEQNTIAANNDQEITSHYPDQPEHMLKATSVGAKANTPSEGPIARAKEAIQLAPPSWLPAGWKVEEKTRLTGKSAGSKDKYYMELSTGRRFRARTEVVAYLESGGKVLTKGSKVQAIKQSPVAEKKNAGKLSSIQSPASGLGLPEDFPGAGVVPASSEATTSAGFPAGAWTTGVSQNAPRQYGHILGFADADRSADEVLRRMGLQRGGTDGQPMEFDPFRTNGAQIDVDHYSTAGTFKHLTPASSLKTYEGDVGVVGNSILDRKRPAVTLGNPGDDKRVRVGFYGADSKILNALDDLQPERAVGAEASVPIVSSSDGNASTGFLVEQISFIPRKHRSVGEALEEQLPAGSQSAAGEKRRQVDLSQAANGRTAGIEQAYGDRRRQVDQSQAVNGGQKPNPVVQQAILTALLNLANDQRAKNQVTPPPGIAPGAYQRIVDASRANRYSADGLSEGMVASAISQVAKGEDAVAASAAGQYVGGYEESAVVEGRPGEGRFGEGRSGEGGAGVARGGPMHGSLGGHPLPRARDESKAHQNSPTGHSPIASSRATTGSVDARPPSSSANRPNSSPAGMSSASAMRPGSFVALPNGVVQGGPAVPQPHPKLASLKQRPTPHFRYTQPAETDRANGESAASHVDNLQFVHNVNKFLDSQQQRLSGLSGPAIGQPYPTPTHAYHTQSQPQFPPMGTNSAFDARPSPQEWASSGAAMQLGSLFRQNLHPPGQVQPETQVASGGGGITRKDIGGGGISGKDIANGAVGQQSRFQQGTWGGLGLGQSSPAWHGTPPVPLPFRHQSMSSDPPSASHSLPPHSNQSHSSTRQSTLDTLHPLFNQFQSSRTNLPQAQPLDRQAFFNSQQHINGTTHSYHSVDNTPGNVQISRLHHNGTENKHSEKSHTNFPYPFPPGSMPLPPVSSHLQSPSPNFDPHGTSRQVKSTEQSVLQNCSAPSGKSGQGLQHGPGDAAYNQHVLLPEMNKPKEGGRRPEVSEADLRESLTGLGKELCHQAVFSLATEFLKSHVETHLPLSKMVNKLPSFVKGFQMLEKTQSVKVAE